MVGLIEDFLRLVSRVNSVRTQDPVIESHALLPSGHQAYSVLNLQPKSLQLQALEF